MTDRPIIFSAPMIQALLAGRKTQTRRILKPYDGPIGLGVTMIHGPHPDYPESPDTARIITAKFKPRYAADDRLYVRENHALVPASAYRMSEGVVQTVNPADRYEATIYAAGWDRSKPKWRPSIHMPRWASRLTLLVTDVRVQRLQDISEEDAVAEGIYWNERFEGYSSDHEGRHYHGSDPARSFESLWDGIHGEDAWEANPWICAVSFTVQHGNIDALPVAA